MFSFINNFLTRGITALFSYFSWQVQVSTINRFLTTLLVTIVTFLCIALML